MLKAIFLAPVLAAIAVSATAIPSIWLILPTTASAQQVASGSAKAGVASSASNGVVTTVYSTQPITLSPPEMARFQEAMAKSNRSGPTNLPRAPHGLQTGASDAGPAFDFAKATPASQSLSNAPTLPTDIFAIDRTDLALGGQYSAVSEPSGDSAGHLRFHTANWYAASSQDFGQTWSLINPFTMFGSGFCCDQVVRYNPERNLWFWLLQYNDGHLVLASSQDLVSWCSLTLNTSQIGVAGEYDYNDMAMGTNNIYVVSNVFPNAGGSGVVVQRIPMDQMLACGSVNWNYFYRTDLGFTWKPVDGASDVMYWGTNWFGTLGSSFRVFSWPENSGTITWFDRTLGTTFAFFTRNSGQNCASADNVVKNWCQYADSRVLGGARYRDPNGVEQLVWSFNASQGGPFNLPFPYTEIVHFKQSDISYLSSDRIWNPTVAFQFTSLATNSLGHIGMTTLWGGGTGTTHNFLSGAAFLIDDVSPTQPWNAAFNAIGSGNVCDAGGGVFRTGDYTSTRAYRPVNTPFVGMNFVLTGDAGGCGSTAPVVDHDVIFGRYRDAYGGLFRWP